MRVLLFFVLTFILVIPFYHLANAFPEGTPLSSYDFKSGKLALSKPVLAEMVYLPTTDFNENEALLMINNLQKIDGNILHLAAEQSIQIKLFTGSLTDQNGLSRLKDSKPKGYTDSSPNWDLVPGLSDNRFVYAKIGHSEFGKGHGSISLELHEAAHAIDRYVFNYVRKDPIFTSIWKREVHELFPLQNYFINFPEEYFAETFAMYYYNESSRLKLKEKAPLTFGFITGLEKKAAELRNKSYYN